ncbi:MAG: HAD family phosphatase [Thalassovita sp.]
MTPKAIVFDLGRVLLEYDPEAFYDRVIGEDRRKELFAAVDLDGYNLRVDEGEPLHATLKEAADAHPDYADEIMMWAERWVELLPGDIPHSVRLLEALKAKSVPVLALTNFGAETFEIAAQHFPFLHLFDAVYVSGRLKCIKPDAAIYEALEQGSNYRGAELLFADDKAENIEAAAVRGWQTHLFTDPQGWADALVAAGVLTLEEAA